MKKEKLLKSYQKYTDAQLKIYSVLSAILGVVIFLCGTILYVGSSSYLFLIILLIGFILVVYSIIYEWVIKQRKNNPDLVQCIPEYMSGPNGEILILKGFNGQVSVYDNRIEIKRKGFNGLMTHGLAGDKTIPIESITSIQLKKGGFFKGFIQFGVIGGIERQFGKNNAMHDENSVVILARHNKAAFEIKNYLESKIISPKKIQIINNDISVPDEIAKYKKLLDDGIISETEFEYKKKQLLNT